MQPHFQPPSPIHSPQNKGGGEFGNGATVLHQKCIDVVFAGSIFSWLHLGGKTSANLSKSLEAVISALSSRKWVSMASRSCSKTIRETALISGV